MMFIKIGYRNIFRNKRRSLLTSIIIGLGLAAMIITDGFLSGMNENMIKIVTNSLVGEGQIHHPKFRDSMKIEDQIQNISKVKEILDSDVDVKAYSQRTISFAMISSPRAMKNVSLYGIEPDKEILVSNINKQIIEGDFVSNENSLVIGDTLQKRLSVRLGDKVVVTVAKAKSGEISQELFRITGIIKAGSKEMDEKSAFIHISRGQRLLGIEDNIHEIAVKFKNISQKQKDHSSLWEKINVTGNLGESWENIVSSFVGMMSLVDQLKGLIAMILIVLVALGIINTLFMALYERMFEFSVLRALGTKGREIILMIVSEAGSLSLVSIIAGIIIALFIAIPLKIWGVDFTGIDLAQVTFKEPIYFVFTYSQFIIFPIATFIFTLIVGFYPAIHASRIKMSEAMKRSL